MRNTKSRIARHAFGLALAMAAGAATGYMIVYLITGFYMYAAVCIAIALTASAGVMRISLPPAPRAPLVHGIEPDETGEWDYKVVNDDLPNYPRPGGDVEWGERAEVEDDET